jgi:hypothetical protein
MMAYSLPTAAQHYAEAQRLSDPAALLFSTALSAGRRRGWWAALLRRSTALRTLAQAQPASRNGRYAGRKLVSLDAIRGTEGRAGDFDNQFYPLSDQTRQRWLSVANALEAGVPLPPVQLIQVGGEFFVRDGHHRISVARALGQTSIEADVSVLNAA